MAEEKDRFYSRLASIPGVQALPSIGDWILLEVTDPRELARRVSRRLIPGLISVPRHLDGAVRIMVSDPKTNEQVFQVVRDAVAA